MKKKISSTAGESGWMHTYICILYLYVHHTDARKSSRQHSIVYMQKKISRVFALLDARTHTQSRESISSPSFCERVRTSYFLWILADNHTTQQQQRTTHDALSLSSSSGRELTASPTTHTTHTSILSSSLSLLLSLHRQSIYTAREYDDDTEIWVVGRSEPPHSSQKRRFVCCCCLLGRISHQRQRSVHGTS